ncbi:MAG: hypothetical protein ACLP1X_33670 [Polyangiaceae bacterium]
MNRPLVRFSKVFASLGVVAGIGLSALPEASAQEVVVQPDDAFIATAEPVYNNGVAHYWYGNRWYYRNGRSWASYAGGEPAYLHDYRFRTWPGGVYHAGYHYNAGYHGGGHRR